MVGDHVVRDQMVGALDIEAVALVLPGNVPQPVVVDAIAEQVQVVRLRLGEDALILGEADLVRRELDVVGTHVEVHVRRGNAASVLEHEALQAEVRAGDADREGVAGGRGGVEHGALARVGGDGDRCGRRARAAEDVVLCVGAGADERALARQKRAERLLDRAPGRELRARVRVRAGPSRRRRSALSKRGGRTRVASRRSPAGVVEAAGAEAAVAEVGAVAAAGAAAQVVAAAGVEEEAVEEVAAAAACTVWLD
jgi:hypothetical protein